jgi:methionine biosynthesis protein MetW
VCGKGLFCYHGDIDEGLSDYKDNSFDYVILNQTLQSTKKPEYVLKEIMRIGRNAIISFPNFGFIKTRLQLLVHGRMPKNTLLPYEWYETPDIHHLTIRDFKFFCSENNFIIKKEKHFDIKRNSKSNTVQFIPKPDRAVWFFCSGW